MKVLWFTNTPSLGESVLGQPTASGGWIKSLEYELSGHVELSVAFYQPGETAPFTLKNTTYYPIRQDRPGIAGKIRQRVNRSLEPDSDLEKFMSIVRTVQPDLIHIHGTEGPFGLIQSMTDIPVLISIQGLISVCELKYFSGISEWQVKRFASLKSRFMLNSYSDQYKRFSRQARRERRILAMSSHLTGRTDWDRRVTSILAPRAAYYPANEILRATFYLQHWQPLQHRELRLFTITGSNLFKGFETILQCAQLIDRLNLPYTWEIAGISDSDPLVALSESALSIKRSPNIRLLGRLDEEHLSSAMLQSDIYVGVSHIENSPNSLCEALLMGIPCISTYAGGTSSLITNEYDGILVQDGDPFAMAGAISELAADPVKRAKFSNNARERASMRHDRTAIRETFLNLYRQIAGHDRPSTYEQA